MIRSNWQVQRSTWKKSAHCFCVILNSVQMHSLLLVYMVWVLDLPLSSSALRRLMYSNRFSQGALTWSSRSCFPAGRRLCWSILENVMHGVNILRMLPTECLFNARKNICSGARCLWVLSGWLVIPGRFGFCDLCWACHRGVTCSEVDAKVSRPSR